MNFNSMLHNLITTCKELQKMDSHFLQQVDLFCHLLAVRVLNCSYRNVDIKLIRVCPKDCTLRHHSQKKLLEVVLKTPNLSSVEQSGSHHIARQLSVLSFNHPNIFIRLILNCCRIKESKWNQFLYPLTPFIIAILLVPTFAFSFLAGGEMCF